MAAISVVAFAKALTCSIHTDLKKGVKRRRLKKHMRAHHFSCRVLLPDVVLMLHVDVSAAKANEALADTLDRPRSSGSGGRTLLHPGPELRGKAPRILYQGALLSVRTESLLCSRDRSWSLQ
jgi:hypothetical protein